MAQRCFSADWTRPLARWGETLIEEKATRPGMHFESPYRFNGKELDEETGLYYYGARYYNPMVSVWLGVDPLAAHINQVDKSPYAYTWNNPVNLIDPDGRCPKCEEAMPNAPAGTIYIFEDSNYEWIKGDDGEWTGYSAPLEEVTIAVNVDLNANSQSQKKDEVVFGISLGTNMIEDAAKTAANLEVKNAVNPNSNFVKTNDAAKAFKKLGRAAGVFGGVLGLADNSYEAYKDFQEGNNLRGYAQTAQALGCLAGTILLFTPAAPIGGAILTIITISDFAEFFIESSN
jgi:RHS repeat-associated protein